MAPKSAFPFQGRQVAGENIDFEPTAEPFSQYTLADGTSVKAKLVMLNAARLEEFNDNGDPFYQFNFQQIIGVVVPPELKRKVQ